VGVIHDRLTERGHEASKRTVYRDLQALSQAGFPLFPEGEQEASTLWRLERNTRIHQYLALTAKELFALFLARGALTPLQSTPFFEDLQGIFRKLEERLGARQIDYLKQLESELKFEPGPAWGLGLNPDILETLRAGCAEGQLVEGVYYSVNSRTESQRKLGPHYLYYAQGGLYLVAEDLADQKVKVFAVPRFKSANLLDEPYEGKISSPEELFDGGMAIYNGVKAEEVVLEFEADVAHFVKERRWHPSQRITNLDQGRIRMQLEVGITPELTAWILGFGSSARALKPEGLIEELRNAAKRLTDLYR
jgi:predicted DNA-binding transcriptional regulator YafY